MAKQKEQYVQPTLPIQGIDDMVEVPTGTESLAIAPMQYSSEPQFGADEILIPMLRLAQGLTPEVAEGTARPGDWLMTGFPTAKSVTIVPLAFARKRERGSVDAYEKRIVICRSNDAKVGEGDPGGACDKCPCAVFGGPCDLIYVYKAYVVENKALALVQFKRTSMPVAKSINTMVMQHGFGKFAVTLASQKREGKKGVYFVANSNPVTVSEDVLTEAQEA
jgi:hypothetical protein